MSLPGPRVLIVDDNAELRENLAEILEAEGYQVLQAGSCRAARAVGRESFDVALIDVRLPDGEGTALAGELKAGSPLGEVVLLTGFATLESATEAVRAGAFAYLVKPCATPQLLMTLEQALRQIRLHADREALARRARTAEKLAAVGTLTAGLSHEIRNPLNSASLQLTVLERRVRRLAPELQGPLLEPLTLVGEEIRRLDHTLEDFLQFARPGELTTRRLELSPLLERVLGFLEVEAAERGVRLERALEPGLSLEADEDRLRQVLVNLALNAMDAAGRGGWVRVTARRSTPGWVRVALSDSGPGIPPELRERIFEPFFTTKPAGSGLGLSIVNAIVTQHGGTLGVEQDDGGGARFVLELREAPGAQAGSGSPEGG